MTMIKNLFKYSRRFDKGAGFTLIEIVVTLVISSVMAAGIFTYIGRTVDGITTASSRNRLASSGRVAVDRLAFELHNALPNSIRVSTPTAGGDQCIEFIPVIAATTYLTPAFRTPNLTSFNVVDFVEGGVVTVPTSTSSMYGVIYPSNLSRLYRDGNLTPVRSTIHEITSIVDIAVGISSSEMTINTASGRYRRRSPNERFFVVQQPVSFCVVSNPDPLILDNDKLFRYTNYGFSQNQPTTELPLSNVCALAAPNGCLSNYNTALNKVLIMDRINNTGLTAFTVGNQNLRRNSLVAIELKLQSGGDEITLNNEVLARSVP